MRNLLDLIVGGAVTAIAITVLACRAPVTPPDAGPDASLPTQTDAAGPDLYERACAGLRNANCLEGYEAKCPVVLRYADKHRTVNFHPDCLANLGPDAEAVDVAACRVEATCLPK